MRLLIKIPKIIIKKEQQDFSRCSFYILLMLTALRTAHKVCKHILNILIFIKYCVTFINYRHFDFILLR